MIICSLCREDKPASGFVAGRSRCRECRIWADRLRYYGRLHELHEKIDTVCKQWSANYASGKPWLTRVNGPWLPIPGYFGLYEVSAHGEVLSLWFINGSCNMPRTEPKLISLHTRPGVGYTGFTAVGHDGKRATTNVHSAMMRAFVPQPDAEHWHVAHIDGDGSHNELSNLRWATPQENEADKKRHGRTLTGSRNHQSKLTEKAVVEMRKIAANDPAMPFWKLGELFGVSDAVANKVVRRMAWRHVA